MKMVTRKAAMALHSSQGQVQHVKKKLGSVLLQVSFVVTGVRLTAQGFSTKLKKRIIALDRECFFDFNFFRVSEAGKKSCERRPPCTFE